MFDTGSAAESAPMWEATGLRGVVLRFDGRQVTVARETVRSGALGGGTRGTRAVPVEAITTLVWTEPGLVSPGWIGVEAPGLDRPWQLAKGATRAKVDPYTVAFRREQRDEFAAVRDAIEEARSRYRPSAR